MRGWPYELAVIWALCSILSAAAGETRLVWQIGEPDKSSAEFALAGNYRAFEGRFGAAPVVFEVGRSQAARDWPFIQPGPEDEWAGSRIHPFTIRFGMARQPRGNYTLRVELADVHAGSRPTFLVTVGGRKAQFRLQPGGGEAPLDHAPGGKPQRIELIVPGNLFHPGTNDIVLAVAGGSWVLYDALALWNEPQAGPDTPEILSVAAETTPFFIRQQGRVCRALNVKVTANSLLPEVVLGVQGHGERIDVPIKDPIWFCGLSQEAGATDTSARRPGAERSRTFRLSQEAGVPQLEIGAPDSAESFEATVTAQAGAQTRGATVRVNPQTKWKIFAAPSAHTDIGYTDLQSKCVERHNENTDLALELMPKFPDFKWNLEVAWQAENYFAARQGEKIERFVRYAREGRLGIQALYDNILTGLCSHEAGCRLTCYAHSLCARYGLPCRSAMISDVPTQQASLPMLLAGAGIRYFSSGINNERAYPFTRMQDLCPCWWEGPDGSRVLMMFAPGYGQAAQWSLTRNLDAARTRLLVLLRGYDERRDYPYDAIWLHGALGDNGELSPGLAETAKAWNEHYEFPKVILSRNDEFFEYIEQRFGDKLPVVRGDGGAYWEDGAGSSARETALCRNAQESLAQAEILLALAQPAEPVPAPYPSSALGAAWRNCLLYDEHIWGAYSSITDPDKDLAKRQWQTKAQFALDADAQARALLEQGAARWVSLVRMDAPSLVVINSASWPRTEVVQARLPQGTTVVEPGVPACEGEDGTLLLVKDVPACGYRVLKLGRGAGPPAPQPEPAEGASIESRFYRLTFDPVSGAITGLLDKELRRELVDARAPHPLNQYLYVSGGEGSRIVADERAVEPKLNISAPATATLRRLRLGGLGERMIVESCAEMTPRLVSEVTVWNDLRRVDIVNRFTKTPTRQKEAVYFSFPFAAANPTFRYECPDGIVNANTGMLPGACLEWFAVQHFVEIETGDAAIGWTSPDSPLVCFQDINRGKWPRRLSMDNGHLYAYVMNNYWYTNYKPEQGGEQLFRFSITSRAKADNTASARFGWAASNPLLALCGQAKAGAPLPPGSASLVEVREPNVLLLCAKQAEAGGALVLRLWEVSGQPATAHVHIAHLPARKAVACNLVEEPQGPLELREGVISVPIHGGGLATVMVH
jgi:hypothetical protein